MKYDILVSYSDDLFRRITGIKRTTFEKMLDILSAKFKVNHAKGGRPRKLSLEEMLLATLEYWREYRTYAHIAASYGIHESSMYRLIRWVEDTLVKDSSFSLPSKKALLKSEVEYEVVLIDATETPIERPKKTAKVVFRQEKATHNKDSNCFR